jgi:tetratricopeptide (TPR) repeat protein
MPGLAPTGRAELMAERGELAQASGELNRAAVWAREAGDEVGEAEVERVRALVAYKGGDYAAALAAAEAARQTARTFDSALLAAECTALVALALKRLGRAAEAERERTEAAAAYRSVGAVRLIERLDNDWTAA